MAYEAVDCVDAGTEYCPCYLAETNNCLICSQLQGKLFCDCINWKGVCIYQEYVWNRNKRKESRETLDAKVLEKYYVNDRVIFIKLKVTRTLARELNQPGSYVFIRNVNDPEFFDVPMSVMYSDEVAETADMLIQVRGVKTKSLEDVGDLLLVRGPYWNGILGLKNLKSIKDKNCLIIVRGIAQAASVLAAKKLCYSGNKVSVLLDEGSAGTVFSERYLTKMGCTVKGIELLEKKKFKSEALTLIEEEINNKDISLLFSGGSDFIHKNIIDIIKNTKADILFSCTNNSSICCGEGVCGSCTTRLNDGKRIKCCKAQIDPVYIIGGIF
jgi:NAD(P)H-flavin reductase